MEARRKDFFLFSNLNHRFRKPPDLDPKLNEEGHSQGSGAFYAVIVIYRSIKGT
jgi:hypothetical protein